MRQPKWIAILCVTAAATAWAAPRFTFHAETDLELELRVESFIHEWVHAGPFPVPDWGDEAAMMAGWRIDWIGGEALASLDDESVWRPLEVDREAPAIDLIPIFGDRTFTVVYVATHVFAKEAGAHTLLLGSDDGVVAWWNGEKVHENLMIRGCVPDEDRVTVQANAGANVLVLKITQAERGWGFAARFDNSSGLSTGTSPDPKQARPLPTTDEAIRDLPAAFMVRPYLQNTGVDKVTVMWKTNVPSLGTLRIHTPDGSFSATTPDAKRLHEVRVTGLTPDTNYPYLVEVWNPTSSARRAKPAGGNLRTFPVEPRPVKLLIYGDTRTNPERHAVVINRMCAERDVDAVLHSGDLMGDALQRDQWISEFFEPAGPLIANQPMFFSLGNHENSSPLYFTYLDHPTFTDPAERYDAERWYSFDLGPLHIVSIDSNFDFSQGSEQLTWVEQNLERNRDRPWKILMFHHPVYTSGPHGRLGDDARPMAHPNRTAQEVIPGLAKEYGIPLVITGHDHVYERSEVDGVYYVISGGGGAPNYRKTDDAERQNPHSQVFHSSLNFCVVVADETRMELVAKDEKGHVLDRIHVTRNK